MTTRPLLVALIALAFGCTAEEVPPEPTPVPEEPGNGPMPEFDRFCGDTWWEETLERADADPIGGIYNGAFDNPVGTLDAMKLMPEHPFQAESIRVMFLGDPGPVKIRLSRAFGRSYPGVDEAEDLIPPIETVVEAPDPNDFTRFELPDDVFLLPGQHYILSVERLVGGPVVAMETVAPGAVSRALMLVPGEFLPWSSDLNFRMKIRGNRFCPWTPEQRWFQPQDVPFEGSAPHVTDVNGDGNEDLVIDGGGPHVWLGDGAGGFTLDEDAFPEDAQAAATFYGDLDNDGDVDAFAANWAPDGTEDAERNHIWLNDGSGGFTMLPDAGVENFDNASCAGMGDGDGDGVLDLYYGNWLVTYPQDPSHPDEYYEGNGDGTFTSRFTEAGLELPRPYSCYGVLWNDYNNDGAQDIYVGNYHLYPNQLWQNQGDGTYVNVAEEVGAAFDDVESGHPWLTGGHSYGGDFGDVDNDGDMDAYIANLAHPREAPWSDPSMFLLNSGAPDYTFENLFEERGFQYDEGDLNATFGDFDNDMDLDLMVTSVYRHHYARIYSNDGAGNFTDVTYEAGLNEQDVASSVWADFDQDGDLDLVIKNRLFLNDRADARHWVQLELQGTETNRDAIGARIRLTAGGVTQMRDVRGPGGHVNAQSSRVVHFGLGPHTEIESVEVRWVGGDTETISGVEADERMLIVEGSGTALSR